MRIYIEDTIGRELEVNYDIKECEDEQGFYSKIKIISILYRARNITGIINNEWIADKIFEGKTGRYDCT